MVAACILLYSCGWYTSVCECFHWTRSFVLYFFSIVVLSLLLTRWPQPCFVSTKAIIIIIFTENRRRRRRRRQMRVGEWVSESYYCYLKKVLFCVVASTHTHTQMPKRTKKVFPFLQLLSLNAISGRQNKQEYVERANTRISSSRTIYWYHLKEKIHVEVSAVLGHWTFCSVFHRRV